MYINKSKVKVSCESKFKDDRFIISITGDINDGDYISTFQFLDKTDGIKAIEELCQLYEWILASQDKKSGKVLNFNLCPIEFEYLEIPCNEQDWCHTIVKSWVGRIDSKGELFAVHFSKDIDE